MKPFGRGMLIAPLYFIGILNGFAAKALAIVNAEGFWPAFAAGFDISAVAMAASVLAFIYAYRALGDDTGRVGLLDVAVAIVIILMIVLPHRAMSWGAVTLLGSYALVSSRRSVNAVAAASLVLGLAASAFWSGIAIQAFAGPLLSIDAALVANVLAMMTEAHISYTGNVISISGQAPLVVIVGCDSLTNVVYGFLCWLTIARFFQPQWRWHDLIGIMAVTILVVVFNSVRVALMGLDADTYEWMHDGLGAQIFGFSLVVAVSMVSLASIRNSGGLLAR